MAEFQIMRLSQRKASISPIPDTTNKTKWRNLCNDRPACSPTFSYPDIRFCHTLYIVWLSHKYYELQSEIDIFILFLYLEQLLIIACYRFFLLETALRLAEADRQLVVSKRTWAFTIFEMLMSKPAVASSNCANSNSYVRMLNNRTRFRNLNADPNFNVKVTGVKLFVHMERSCQYIIAYQI